MSKVKIGEEITICYLEDVQFKERNKRQNILLDLRAFVCSCDLCQNYVENDCDFEFYKQFKEKSQCVENLMKDRERCLAKKDENSCYQVPECRKEVDLYKELYTLGKARNGISLWDLFGILRHGFDAAYLGEDL